MAPWIYLCKVCTFKVNNTEQNWTKRITMNRTHLPVNTAETPSPPSYRPRFFFFGCAGSQLRHSGSLVVSCGLFLVAACGLLVAACMWDLVPRPGIEPGPPVLGVRSLTHWTTREVPVPRPRFKALVPTVQGPFSPRRLWAEALCPSSTLLFKACVTCTSSITSVKFSTITAPIAPTKTF